MQHLGYKSAMVNISDIFAMNGTPRQMVVSIALSKRFKVEDLDDFYKGLRMACDKWGVDIVGGDTTSSLTGLAISITCIGEAAKEDMAYISGQEYPDSFYIYLDYVYASNLMAELNDLPSAITYYEKALKRDTTKVAGLKELASLYRRNKQAKEGIETYQRYLAALGDKVTLSDRFGLGQQYLTASQQAGISPEEKAKYVEGGDKIFSEILKEDTPDAYKAALLRAAIHITDGSKPEENVKQLYEEALKLMEGKEDINSAKLQALRYLAFYHVQKDELDLARKYTNDILAIDAGNAFAKQIDAYLKSANK